MFDSSHSISVVSYVHVWYLYVVHCTIYPVPNTHPIFELHPVFILVSSFIFFYVLIFIPNIFTPLPVLHVYVLV